MNDNAAFNRMVSSEANLKNLMRQRFFISNDTNFHDSKFILMGSSAGLGKSMLMRMIQDFYDSLNFTTIYYLDSNRAQFFIKNHLKNYTHDPNKIFFLDDCDSIKSNKIEEILSLLKNDPTVYKVFMTVSTYREIVNRNDTLIERNGYRGSQLLMFYSDVVCSLKRNLNDPSILLNYEKNRFESRLATRFINANSLKKQNFFDALINEYEELGFDLLKFKKMWRFDYSKHKVSNFKELFNL